MDIEKNLRARLYRVTCPSPDELGEYHLQILPDRQMQLLTQHLPICPHCRRELAQLEDYLTALAPELNYNWGERIEIWIARLLAQNPEQGFVPTLALRGQEDGPSIYEAGSYQLSLEIQGDPMKPGYKSILGLIVGGADAAFLAQLWQEGRSLQETAVDDLGNFIFTGVQPGTYELILSQRIGEIHVPAFAV